MQQVYTTYSMDFPASFIEKSIENL